MNLHSNGGMRIDYKMYIQAYYPLIFLKQTLNIEASTHDPFNYISKRFYVENYSSIINVHQVK